MNLGQHGMRDLAMNEISFYIHTNC